MESNGKFTLIVFNTCTQEYEEVIVTEEVYRTYCRTRWNIKDNDQSFFDHEIQTSGMIGSQDGAYENFREFIDAINTPEHIILEQIKKEALYQAISALPAWRLGRSEPFPQPTAHCSCLHANGKNFF